LASEPHSDSPADGEIARLVRWVRTGRAARTALISAVTLLLAATLLFLYYKTQGADFKRQNEVIAYLRELKEIDARWDVEILRLRSGSELQHPQAAGYDYTGQRERVLVQLAAAAQDVRSPVLARGLPELSTAFREKAEAVGKFKQANAATRAALKRVMGAETEIAGLVRGAWQDYSNRERLVALETAIAQLLARALEYYHTPAADEREPLRTMLADLRDSSPKLPPALQAGIARVEGNVRQLMEAKPVEVGLGNKLGFLPAGPRVDSLTNAFTRELEEALTSQERYRVYLIAYAASLLILIGYLAARLIASYRLLNQANLALKAANEGLEQRVRERTHELSQALEQLKESEAQLIQSEKMSSLGQMVAGVAHEINTPLAYVKNSLGSVKKNLPQLTLLAAEAEKLLLLLQSGAADPRQLSRQFALVQTVVKRMRQHQVLEELQALVGDGLHGIAQISDIVLNLKDFSRLDRSRVSVHNINESIDSTLMLAKHELKRVTVKKELSQIPKVTCSPSQINQVLLNIITNAAHAVEPGKGVITIKTRTEGSDRVAVEIADNGAGIRPEVLPKIFDPFFTTKKVGQGTGLGLSIVYKIVKQHGGDITVKSEIGVGSTFTVFVPLTPPETAEIAAEDPSVSPQLL
jgi:two-component system, NtrC family, sensor kinase